MIQLIRNIRKWISVRRRKTYEDWLVKQEIMPGTVERYLKIRDEYVGMQVKEYGMFRFYMRVFPLSEGRVLAFLKEKKSTQLLHALFAVKKYNEFLVEHGVQEDLPAATEVCRMYCRERRDTSKSGLEKTSNREVFNMLLQEREKIQKGLVNQCADVWLMIFLLLCRVRY